MSYIQAVEDLQEKNQENAKLVAKLKKMLPDNLYDSKDWKTGDIVGRVEWLIAMYEDKKAEVQFLGEQLAESSVRSVDPIEWEE